MDEKSDVVRRRQPDAIDDHLTEVLRAGARHLVAQAVDFTFKDGTEVTDVPADRAA